MGAFDPPPLLIRFFASPLLFLLRPFYTLILLLRKPPRTRSPSQRPIRVVCISDTHDLRPSSIPHGDLLIHAGDLTNSGTRADIQKAVDWLKTLPHAHKVVVSGNHDGWLDVGVRGFIAEQNGIGEEEREREREVDWGHIHYLQNSSVTIEFPEQGREQGQHARALTIHGAPQIPQLDPSRPTIHAFQYPPTLRGSPFPTPIPANADILVTHSPPLHHRDNYPYAVGCPHLLNAVWSIRPSLHVFGHCHVGRGVERAYYDRAQRAWERLCAAREERRWLWERGSKGLLWWALISGGWWRDMLGVDGMWRDATVVVWEGVKRLLWERVWGGDGKGLGREGWMVNAACLDGWGSGELRGGGIVVDI
ncbi:hypothetical protein AJ79_05321 [Helicocarpus griseus UAMH5409]|uniref:Calcineurin-like phosphoesterase domain-containing protein n=1 Tax=Helicocarpus griseus UAMH5409 TaxID=1447875 RepID=A0A2B7XP70_9EURO|nr:hypothetical protein AJ79_05321 [Helicocarpus griseus UAMH5409]